MAGLALPLRCVWFGRTRGVRVAVTVFGDAMVPPSLQQLVGKVVSARMAKTVTVLCERTKWFPKYKTSRTKHKKFYVSDAIDAGDRARASTPSTASERRRRLFHDSNGESL